ncbi:MAG: 3-hydroxyacyl-CoA dehydrogenase family protein [Candidatus Accumulibacter sp.]|jgi:3-hydroxybutyryl-CoA dehydrogenase|nr:3-hydroxyacyl-CoA dehydrogenase family protein [Accumulibacter sp.]
MKLQEVRKIALFGAGTMGPGIAQVFALAGYEVAMYSRKKETLNSALSVVRANLRTFVEHGLLKQEDAAQAVEKISPTQSIEEAAKSADVVVESIVEKKDAKKELYEQLNVHCPAQTIFTSNTSALNIYDVVPADRLPNTIIAHWFAPPHIIPLVEVVLGPKTRKETVDFTVELLKHVDRVPVIMEKFVPGFCINRILRALGREIFFLLDNGYMSAEQLDLAVKASIIPRAMVLGLVQRYDFTGLDISAKNLENKEFIDPPNDNAPKSLFDLVRRGDLGVKTGKGFFDYSDRSLEQVLTQRDDALIDVFNATKHLIYKKI